MATRTVPTRRAFLAGLGGGTALAAWPMTAATPAPAQILIRPVTLDEFMELSEVLTDKVGPLKDEVGLQYQAALDPAALERLVDATVRRNDPPETFNEVLKSGALNDPTNALTAQQILVYWYSGLIFNVGIRRPREAPRDGDRTAAYVDALAWTTLPFAEPASTPLGFPKWEDRP